MVVLQLRNQFIFINWCATQDKYKEYYGVNVMVWGSFTIWVLTKKLEGQRKDQHSTICKKTSKPTWVKRLTKENDIFLNFFFRPFRVEYRETHVRSRSSLSCGSIRFVMFWVGHGLTIERDWIKNPSLICYTQKSESNQWNWN